ncbi:MAG: hypothetical protein ABFC97_07110 [Anaerolineaceae bacterium]
MKKLPSLYQDLILTFVSSLVLSLGIAVVEPKPFLQSWLATNLLLWLVFFILFRLWRGFQGGRKLILLMVITFFSRLLLGVFVTSALPQIGFDTEVENAGYLYSDAYRRDLHSFTLAQSDAPLVTSFSNDAGSDQYGGLMFLTAAVYRLFNLESPHPLLITILASFVMTAGLAFLLDGLRRRWGNTVALAAGWFYALYPEGVLLGSSQMREPFLIGLFCVAFWAVVNWKEKTGQKLLIFMLCAVFSLAFSLPFGAILVGLLVAYGLVEWIAVHPSQRVRRFGLLLLAALGVVGLIAGWMWLKPTLYYDAFITRSSSGNITVLLERMGEKWQMPFITFYGITQPFLPGALTDPSLPFWRITSIVRALGWWFMLPFLPYGFFALWKARSKSDRWALLLIVVALIGWILISALRAGGDMWDNPRYRALLIPWFGLLFGWCWQRFQQGHLSWFLRWVGAELVFFLVFLFWYFFRYQIIHRYIGFFQMIQVILVGAGLILFSGLVSDFLKRRARHLSEKGGTK